MAFSQISTSVTIINSNLIGYNAISFTNFDNTSEPAIASGSSIEIAGAFFKADGDISITNWAGITTGVSCYIVLTPSGSAGSQTLAAAYTTTAPVWVTDKNGWYASAASNVRYVGTVYKSGTSDYYAKRIISNNQKTLGGVNVATNFAIGSMALYALTTGLYNIAIGDYALQLNTTGSRNTAIGYATLNENTTGTENVAIGFAALNKNTIGLSNIAVGYYSLNKNISGSNNVAMGYNVLTENTTGNYNVAIGGFSMIKNTTGSYNTAIGSASLQKNITGTENVAIGSGALGNNTNGAYNTAVGVGALSTNSTGHSNVAIGKEALYGSTTGTYNTAIGVFALRSCNSGSFNVAVGYNALRTLYGNWDGGYATGNVGIGFNALYNCSFSNRNTAIGTSAGFLITTGENNVCVGYAADPPASTSSNIITLGDSNITVLRCQVTSITALSDKRDKTLIHDISLGVDFINALTPVEFNWDRRDWYENKIPDGSKMGKKDYGFIAQDLLAIQEKFNAPWLDLVMQDNPEKLETTTGKLLPIAIKAIQEMSKEIQMLKEKINA